MCDSLAVEVAFNKNNGTSILLPYCSFNSLCRMQVGPPILSEDMQTAFESGPTS